MKIIDVNASLFDEEQDLKKLEYAIKINLKESKSNYICDAKLLKNNDLLHRGYEFYGSYYNVRIQPHEYNVNNNVKDKKDVKSQ